MWHWPDAGLLRFDADDEAPSGTAGRFDRIVSSVQRCGDYVRPGVGAVVDQLAVVAPDPPPVLVTRALEWKVYNHTSTRASVLFRKFVGLFGLVLLGAGTGFRPSPE